MLIKRTQFKFIRNHKNIKLNYYLFKCVDYKVIRINNTMR